MRISPKKNNHRTSKERKGYSLCISRDRRQKGFSWDHFGYGISESSSREKMNTEIIKQEVRNNIITFLIKNTTDLMLNYNECNYSVITYDIKRGIELSRVTYDTLIKANNKYNKEVII